MIWNATSPDDTTYLANQIHTQIQNDKIMMRERFEASDGTIKAHTAADSEDAGKHLPSLVGFCKVHDTYTDLTNWLTANGAISKSLHAVRSPKSLYTISSGTPIKVYPVDHDTLDGLDDDDHIAYQTRDLIRAFAGNLTVSGNAEVITEGSTGATALPLSHRDEDWETAHGAGTLGSEHFAQNSIKVKYISVGKSATGNFSNSVNGGFSFPWLEQDSSAESRFWYMVIDGANNVGFKDNNGNWLDSMIGYGDYR